MTPARLAEIRKTLKAYHNPWSPLMGIAEELLAALETERARPVWVEVNFDRLEFDLVSGWRIDGQEGPTLRATIDAAREREKGEPR